MKMSYILLFLVDRIYMNNDNITHRIYNAENVIKRYDQKLKGAKELILANAFALYRAKQLTGQDELVETFTSAILCNIGVIIDCENEIKREIKIIKKFRGRTTDE